MITTEPYVSRVYSETASSSSAPLRKMSSRTAFWNKLKPAYLVADLFTFMLVLYVSELAWSYLCGRHTNITQSLAVTALCGVAGAVLLQRSTSRDTIWVGHPILITERTLNISIRGIAVILLAASLQHRFVWQPAAIALTLVPVAVAIERRLLRAYFQRREMLHEVRNGNEVTVVSRGENEPKQFLNLLSLDPGAHASRAVLWYGIGKRILDVSICSLLLFLLSPILMLIAACVRLTSHGPVLFSQERVGVDGKRFTIYKFRSMSHNASPYERSPIDPLDPRITWIGRLLRKTGFDELPQLINVLLGQMSLVGPRPEMPFIVDGYDKLQRQRLRVTPGITGLWQLSADRVYPIHDNIHHDLFYIQNRTLALDFAILIHTLVFAIREGI